MGGVGLRRGDANECRGRSQQIDTQVGVVVRLPIPANFFHGHDRCIVSVHSPANRRPPKTSENSCESMGNRCPLLADDNRFDIPLPENVLTRDQRDLVRRTDSGLSDFCRDVSERYLNF